VEGEVRRGWLRETVTDIRYLQALLGHGSLKTTEVYTYLAQSSYERIESPMDDLEL
jgi:site-specific recombinase XerD